MTPLCLTLAKGRVNCPRCKYLAHKILSRNLLLINIFSSPSYIQVLYSNTQERVRWGGLVKEMVLDIGDENVIAVRCIVGVEVLRRTVPKTINISLTFTPTLPGGKTLIYLKSSHSYTVDTPKKTNPNPFPRVGGCHMTTELLLLCQRCFPKPNPGDGSEAMLDGTHRPERSSRAPQRETVV